VAKNFPHPLPNGWFHLAYGDELAPGALYLARPLPCDGDGPMLAAREWMRPFQSPAAAPS
jgi:hypothetical protein